MLRYPLKPIEPHTGPHGMYSQVELQKSPIREMTMQIDFAGKRVLVTERLRHDQGGV